MSTRPESGRVSVPDDNIPGLPDYRKCVELYRF